MGQPMASSGFESIILPKRGWVDNITTRYRIYTNRECTESVVIEAETASRALKLAAVKRCYRIERFIIEYSLSVNDDDMTEATDLIAISAIEDRRRHDPLVENETLQELTDVMLNMPAASESMAVPVGGAVS